MSPTQAPSCEVALPTVRLFLPAVQCPSVNVKDGSRLETEFWTRNVCSGVKAMTAGEKALFGQFRSYFSGHIKHAVGAYVDVLLVPIQLA